VAYYAEPHEFTAADIESAWAIANHLASVIARFAAMAELEEIIRSNELFAGVLAHDLRNPLNAMMTATQLLLLRARGTGAAEREEKPLQRILSSGRRMSTMIGQLLDFTRARSGGGIPVEPQAANLSDLCAQAAAELELGHPEWRIRRTTSGDPSGTWDPDRMLQIFSNLIANACQHGSPDAPVVVNLDGTAPDRVDIEVHNAGAIPEELVPNLFDPFRSTRFGRDNSRGLGLGLYIVREVVREHRGTVQVTSSAADGTRISIRLPRHAEASAERESDVPWRLAGTR
jgi:signal transduction histidine kinase